MVGVAWLLFFKRDKDKDFKYTSDNDGKKYRIIKNEDGSLTAFEGNSQTKSGDIFIKNDVLYWKNTQGVDSKITNKVDSAFFKAKLL